jgi:protoporphyrinogen oxidase
MQREKVHTLILGAGPSGLAAGYMLAKHGLQPIVLEKDKEPGGLMRSIKHGDFIMDVGRKELYNRIASVDALWSEILGPDYRDYPHRGGILYRGQIIDTSPRFEGFRRGMPWSMFLSCAFDFLSARLRNHRAKPRNVEEYFYQKRGRELTRTFSQGFQEKLTGRKWADIPLPQDNVGENGAGFLSILKEALMRTFSRKEVNTYKGIWRHPAKGSGQISEILAEEITRLGGRIRYQAKVVEMDSAQGIINSVTAEIGSETMVFSPSHVVSSIPPEFLKRFLFPQSSSSAPSTGGGSASTAPKRTVVLVYLFLNEEPQFPHAWLDITCPSTRIGRITNYSGFEGDMVPKGKTCLCCEFYCFGADPLLNQTDEAISQMALDDCAASGLVDASKCFHRLVFRFPGADASQNRDNWMSPSRLKLLTELEQFRNLSVVNRTETDIATLAGLEAAEAIVSGDRTHFDRRVDPAELGIRSESKAFAFELPVPVDD